MTRHRTILLSLLSLFLLSMAGITAFMTFAFYIDRLPFIKQTYEVKAEFANAAGIVGPAGPTTPSRTGSTGPT